jgi:hypothetical protein
MKTGGARRPLKTHKTCSGLQNVNGLTEGPYPSPHEGPALRLQGLISNRIHQPRNLNLIKVWPELNCFTEVSIDESIAG